MITSSLLGPGIQATDIKGSCSRILRKSALFRTISARGGGVGVEDNVFYHLLNDIKLLLLLY